MHHFSPSATSLINWLRKTGRPDIDSIIAYDHEKTNRLLLLHRIIGLPILPTFFVNGDCWSTESNAVTSFIFDNGGETALFSFRIAPIHSSIPFEVRKFYGITVSDFNNQLPTLPVPLCNAMIRITPYGGAIRSSCIMVIHPDGIIGEYIEDTLYALTYGQHSDATLIHFFQTPRSSVECIPADDSAIQTIKHILSCVRAESRHHQELLRSHQFVLTPYREIVGYFEYIAFRNGQEAFTDINAQKLSMNIDVGETIVSLQRNSTIDKRADDLRGIVVSGSGGMIRATAYVMSNSGVSSPPANYVLVVDTLTTDVIPIIQHARAVITQRGGIMSHAAIVARELNIPMVANVRGALKTIPQHSSIALDLSNGTVSIIG